MPVGSDFRVAAGVFVSYFLLLQRAALGIFQPAETLELLKIPTIYSSPSALIMEI